MKTAQCLLVALGLASQIGAVDAHDYEAGALRIIHPWTRPTVGTQSTGAGYMVIRNQGKDTERIVAASSPDLARVEMHVTSFEGNVARMRQVEAFDIRPGAELRLEPRGAHLMLIGTKRALKVGERLPLTIRFERAGNVQVELAVQSAPASAEAHTH